MRELKRIDIPHAAPAPVPPASGGMKHVIEQTMQYVDKGKPVHEIARSLHISTDLAEQICRLYLTHPGVDADKIMTKMGL